MNAIIGVPYVPIQANARFAMLGRWTFWLGLVDALVGWFLAYGFWGALFDPWDLVHSGHPPEWSLHVFMALWYGYRACFAVSVAGSSVSVIRREPARWQALYLAAALASWVLRELGDGRVPAPLP